MRFGFPNLTRPRKSSKAISASLEIPLSFAQAVIARTTGYDDWHDLEQNHAKAALFVLDQDLPRPDFLRRQTDLTLRLANELNIADGDAQYLLSQIRLTGDRVSDIEDQLDIRIDCLRRTTLRLANKRMPGAVGRIKAPGWNNRPVILQKFGRPTTVITHSAITTLADFEYVSPRNPGPLFIPLRLYLPYGIWTEHDGAKVLFSRDYKPLWRIREGREPERLEPWLWISWRDEEWLWDDSESPWGRSTTLQRLEGLLRAFKICALPVLADALPLLVHDTNLRRFSDAIAPLKAQRLAGNRSAA